MKLTCKIKKYMKLRITVDEHIAMMKMIVLLLINNDDGSCSEGEGDD